MAGKKIALFLSLMLSSWAVAASAKDNTILRLKMESTLSLPEARVEPPATSADQGAAVNEVPAVKAVPDSTDKTEATSDEMPAVQPVQSQTDKAGAADEVPAAQPEQDTTDKPINNKLLVVSPERDKPVKKVDKKRSGSTQRFSSNITVGAALVQIDNPSAQFGKLTGVTDDQFYLIGAANVQSRDGARFWNFKANDISLDNQSLSLTGGSSGAYKFHLGYSELNNLISNNSQTPFDGAGGPTLTLPTGFDTDPATTGMATLAASMQSVELGTKRKVGDASFAYELDKNFGLTFSFRRHLKNGVKSVGTLFRDDYIDPQIMVLPEPVNYHTDEFRTGFDWHGERGQANLEYYFSRFSNNDASLTWDNPFDSGPTPNPDPYPTHGRNSLPPDNQHQRFSLSGSFKLASTARISALFERGAMTQNEAFLPYTINPNSVISVPMPSSSANARIDTTLYKLDVFTQPLSALSLHAGYRHYATDNQTPRNLYLMVMNDGGNQEMMNTPGVRYNQPFDSSQNQLSLDSSYYLGYGSTLKLGYELDQKDYLYRAVLSTKENTYSAKLSKRWEATTAFVSLTYGRKRPDSYDHIRALEHDHTSEYLDYLATLPPEAYSDNLPGLRQFDVAERNRQRQGLGVTWVARQDLNFGFHANLSRDEYNASQFGLQEQKSDNYTLDATLIPDEFQSWSIYYTRQNMLWRQASRAYYWFNKVLQSVNLANDWSAQNKDVIDTIGINVMQTFFDDQLPVQLSYAYSDIKTDISFTANPTSTINAPPSDMPTLKGKRHTIDLSGTYGVREDLSLRVGTMMEIYQASDWATDGLPPGSSAIDPKLLTLSGSATDYRVFVLSTALNYRF